MSFCGPDVEEASIKVMLTNGKVVTVRFDGRETEIRKGSGHFVSRVEIRPGVEVAIERFGNGSWRAMHSI